MNNLNIVTDSQVARVLFQGTKAVGVELVDGTKCISPKFGSRFYPFPNYLVLRMCLTDHAAREIILCAGAIDTPKLLLLSGIGPRNHLDEHGIDVVADCPGVGANLMDHPMIRIAAPIRQGIVEAHASAKAVDSPSADSVHVETLDIAASAHGYFKLHGVQNYPGFELLDKDTQAHLTDSLTTAYELVCVCGHNIFLCCTMSQEFVAS